MFGGELWEIPEERKVCGPCCRRSRVPAVLLPFPGRPPAPAASPAAQPRCRQYGYGRRDECGETETENSTRSSAPAVRPGSCRRAPAAREPRRGTSTARRPQTTLIHGEGARVAVLTAAPRPWARRRASARISERVARAAPRDPGRPRRSRRRGRAAAPRPRLSAPPRPPLPSRGAPRPPAAHPPCAGLAAPLRRNGVRFAPARPGAAAPQRGGAGR